MPEFDPYFKWLGIPLEDQPPDHYRLLGIPAFTSDADVIANAINRQVAHVRTFTLGPHSDDSQRILNELAAAKVCLESPEKKAAYDNSLRARGDGSSRVTCIAVVGAAKYLSLARFQVMVGLILLVVVGGALTVLSTVDKTGDDAGESNQPIFGRVRSTLRVADKRSLYCGDFSPDGNQVVTGAWDKMVETWDIQIGQVARSFQGHTGLISSVRFSPDGTLIVSGGDETVRIWDLNSGGEIHQLKGSDGRVMSVDISPDGKRIVSGGYDMAVRVWDVVSGRESLVLQGHSDVVLAVRFSHDGKRIVSGGVDQSVKIWDSESGQEMHSISRHGGAVHSVAFSSDGRRVASGGEQREMNVSDAETGKQVLRLVGHHGTIHSIDFSPDGKWIVSGGSDTTVRVWDAVTGEELIVLLGHSARVRNVRFAPTGKQILSIGRKVAKVWELYSDEGHQVYLDDIEEVSYQVRKDFVLGKHGLSGYERGQLVVLKDGISPEHCLSMHACLPAQGEAFATYELDKKYRRFTSRCTFNGAGPPTRTSSEVTFRVLGDGKTLWVSLPTTDRNSSFLVDVDVSSIDILTLQIDRVSNESNATSIWLDPLLSKTQPPSPGASSLGPIRPGRLQEEASRIHDVPRVMTNSIGMPLVLIPSGKFQMGHSADNQQTTPSEDLYDERHGTRSVTLSKPIYAGMYEVTYDQFQRVMPGTSRAVDQVKSLHPVTSVSWETAVKFCQELSERSDEKEAGRMYRLPTEAEWEYMCRAGTATAFSFGSDQSELVNYGWYSHNSDRRTHQVGQKLPNAFGLYDMHGNVWEWCSDWYAVYPVEATVDPRGPSEGQRRVSRGGGYKHTNGFAMSSNRNQDNLEPGAEHVDLGFRVVCKIGNPQETDQPFTGK